MKKILFLDIDGVLNHGFGPLGKNMIEQLFRIVFQTRCMIVISSSWRFGDMNTIIRQLDAVDPSGGLSGAIVGKLGDDGWATGVKQWLDDWALTNIDSGGSYYPKFAILDDVDGGYSDSPILAKSFFKTDKNVGLTDEIAKRIVKHLNS